MRKILLLLCVSIIFNFHFSLFKSLKAQGCETVATLPWINDFATNFDCWTQEGAGAWSLENGGAHVRATFNNTDSTNTTMLVSQPVTIGSDTLGLRLYWKEKRGNNGSTSSALDVSILVCSGAVFDIEACDTVYSGVANYTNSFVQRSTSMAAYEGQTVRIAFAVSRRSTFVRYMFLSDVTLYSDRMPIATISAPDFVKVGDTATFELELSHGDSSTLSCTWHSSLMDSSWSAASASPTATQHFVYTSTGIDTLTASLVNPYGGMTLSKTVNVFDCGTISTFPWVEPFDYNGSYLECWMLNGFTHNNPGTSISVVNDEGQWYPVTNYLQFSGSSGGYIITPAISLPSDDSTLSFVLSYSNPGTARAWRVLVSPTAATDIALFTDTIDILPYLGPSVMMVCKTDLSAYSGQTIRIALVRIGNAPSLRLISAGIDYDTTPKINAVTVPDRIPTGKPALCTASLRYGSTTGLHYTWDSKSGGIFTTNDSGDSAWVTYPYGGTDDTIAVVASNIYSSDTVSVTTHVIDCNPATSLPWNDGFEEGLFCWLQPDSSNWITRKWSSGYQLWLLRNKGNVLCSNINQDPVYDMIVSKPVTITGTADDSIRLQWNAGTNNVSFAHSYCVMITTGDPTSAPCTYDTIYRADSLVFGNNDTWSNHSVDMSAYIGQTVRVVFCSHPLQVSPSGTFVDLYIDDVTIRPIAVPVITLQGASEVNSHEPVAFTATLVEGNIAGLTFSWHSTLMDTTFISSFSSLSGGSELQLHYTYGGIDTLTVIASNPQGCDTASIVLTVSDCLVASLPWLENFNGVTAANYAGNGSLPNCWHRWWNGNSEYAPHVVNYPIPYTQNKAMVMWAGSSYYVDSVAIVESPYFAAPLAGKILSFWYENYDSGGLSVGYMQNDGFVSVADIEPQSTGLVTTMLLDTFPPDVHRFAFRWKNTNASYCITIDSIQIFSTDTVPYTHIDGPTTVVAFDTVFMQSFLSNGDTTGLTYSWHSTMADAGFAQFSTLNSQFSIVYNTVGTDTVSVIATNAYGSDTAWHTLTVTGLPVGAIYGPSTAYSDDTVQYMAYLLSGVDSNVSFSWHSSMAAAGRATMTSNGSTMSIVYYAGGTDTVTLTTTNVLGGGTTVHTTSIVGCHISTFPWSEDFESGLGDCWSRYTNLEDEWMHNWRVENYYYTSHRGSRCMMSQNLSGQSGVSDWLMMPPVDLPDSGNMALYFWVNYTGSPTNGLKVLVSISGRSLTTAFSDTLFVENSHTVTSSGASYRSTYESRSLSLAQYAGQTVWIAFVHEEPCNCILLDDISIEQDGLPIVRLNGPSTVLSCDTAHYVATLLQGDTTGITYTWHSDMVDAGTAVATTNGATFDIDYLEGGTDVITVTATNSIGSDTSTKSVSITDCEPLTQYPYVVRLNNTPTCWTRNGRWSLNSYYSSGITCMTIDNWEYETTDSWLITREVAVPEDTTHSLTLRWRMLCHHSLFQVFVSTEGRSSHDLFTDTLLAVAADTASWRYFTASLDAYRGQNIYIAFHGSGWYNSSVNYSDMGAVRIDTVQFLLDIDTTHVDPPQPPATIWHTMTILSSDSTMGAVTVSDIYPAGTPTGTSAAANVSEEYPDSCLVTIIATPYEGFRFLGWSDGDTNAERLLLLVSDTTLTAYFDSIATPPLPPDTVWHTVTVAANPEGVCELYGGGHYTDGETVEIGYIMPDTVTVGGYWEFLGWSNGATVNPLYIMVFSDTTISANFQWVEDTTTEGIDNLPMATPGCKISIYPNPAYREVTVSVREPSTISILDMTGRTVISTAQSTAVGFSDTRLVGADGDVGVPAVTSYRFDVSNLTSGAYFVRVATAKGILVRKLIVK